MSVDKPEHSRVLHVIAGLDPSKGGPSVSCPSLACAQIPLCDHVGIFTYNLNQETFHELGLPNQSQLVLHSVPANAIEKVVGRRAGVALDGLISDYDVMHVHGVWNPLLAMACRKAKQAGIPYVIAPRGMLDPWSLKQKKLKKWLALTFKWRKILSGAHFLHALNQDEADLISRLNLKTPIRISPNGIFHEKVRALEEVSGEGYQEKYGNYILFMSRLHYKKGLDYLIDGYRAYLDLGGSARLIVAGPDEGEKNRMLARVGELGLRHEVELIGPVYGDEKYRLLKGAKTFCLPSRQEGFSMAIVEAMAMGVPVVISKECHFPEVSEARAGDVVDLDPEQIGTSLYKFAEGRTDAGARGAELIRSEYIWEAIAPKLLSLYRCNQPA